MSQLEVTTVNIEEDERIGEGGFLVLRRLVLTNSRADGSKSAQYRCDFVERPYGLDAVAIAVYRQRDRQRDRQSDGETEVLLRRGLRPPLAFGRDVDVPIEETETSPFCLEVAAGLIEKQDRGMDGIRQRAVAELDEELGVTYSPQSLESLGSPIVPTPSVIPERLYLFAAKVDAALEADGGHGDGSPMEEGATLEWWRLDEAIKGCVRGDIEDAKTEIILRRLADHLS